MEEEFYSTIKLISGEEIIAKVSYVEEDDCLFVYKPMRVESIKQKKSGQTVDGFTLHDWIQSTYDDLFIIPMRNVMTMTELDKRIQRYYLQLIDESVEDTGKVNVNNFTQRMGYLGSIQETKKILEKIYKIS